jgi:hypothetical protein
MTTEIGQTKVTEVTSMKHRDGENVQYSLTMNFENASADMSTHHYSVGGNAIRFALFGMTPETMTQLANKILATAAGRSEDVSNRPES